MTAAAALGLAAGGGGAQGFGHIVGKLEHFQGAGALFHAAQEAALFQGGDQAVDAGLGFQVQRFLHFVKGGRNAAFAHPFMDEHQQFILFARQHRVSLCRACRLPFGREQSRYIRESFYFSSRGPSTRVQWAAATLWGT